MTIRDIYRLSLGLLAENEADATDYEAQVVPIINIMSQELFELNRAICIYKGVEQLETAPYFEDLSNLNVEMPYDVQICANVIPYGLAAKLALDDEMAKAAYFNNEYVEKQRQFTRYRVGVVEEVY